MAAAVVPEGATKPAATVDYLDAEARAATIAYYIKVHKQTLGDVAQLQRTLRDRLAYGVLSALEAQVSTATAPATTCSASSTRPASRSQTSPPTRSPPTRRSPASPTS